MSRRNRLDVSFHQIANYSFILHFCAFIKVRLNLLYTAGRFSKSILNYIAR